ncbi:MAG: ATP-binding protein [Huintestinicola sp.]
MQKRIYKTICSIVMTAVIVVGLCSVLISFGLYESQAKAALKYAADLVLQDDISAEEMYNRLSEALDYNIRVTEIDADGTVLYDSSSDDHLNTENHGNRPEVIEAFESGIGSSERFSHTLSKTTYYYAVLHNGKVIRFSRDTGAIITVFISILPFFLAAAGLVVLIAVIASDKLSETIMKPIHKLVSSLDFFGRDSHIPTPEDFDEYEELIPMVKTIGRMRRQISEYVEKISREKNTIQLITNNMTEGMILIDKDDNILSINRSAIDLVSPHFPKESGRNIIEFSRNDDFLSLVRQSKEAPNVTGIFSCENRYLRVFISRIGDNESDNSGAVIIIVDETDIHLAEEMRRDFSANVSHELRTPLTTVKGFGEMLANGMITDTEDTVKYGKRIFDESSRLLSVINDIIRLSEIEENGARIFSKTDILYLAQQVSENLAQKADSLKISVYVTGESVEASVNSGYIYELIYNLAENGIKYNHPGGHVTVDVRRRDDKAEIIVSDDGIGIPKDHQGRIFERFYRVDKSHSKQTGGTGLGLSIVKHIVAYHSGSITLESDAEKGTKFIVTVPLIQP